MPAMAPIVVEQPMQSGVAARYELRTSARLDAFERHVTGFAVAARTLVLKLRVAAATSADDEDRAEVGGYVERMAIDGARTEKDMLRDARHQEKRDGTLALAHRRSAIRLAELNAQTVETLMALALEMRAFRSSLTPSDPSPTFDDPTELGHHLDAALRA